MEAQSEFKLPSGATIVVSPAGFGVVKDLHDSVMKSFLSTGGKVEDIDSGDLIFKSLLSAGCSKEVENALFKCGENAFYSPDGSEEKRMKVSRALFDDPAAPAARADYYGIFMQIAKVNLEPFFSALFSVLKTFVPVRNTGSPQ